MSRQFFPWVNQYTMCVALLSMSATLLAQPIVDGNTISWPDDGWYQVQNESSYESLCEGGHDCQVPDGRYIVINHSSGERFVGIEIPAKPAGNSLIVVGNTISWPDDGWYQVQNAATYESLCQGGRECEVPDGTYIVINHSSSQRIESIVVPAQSGGDGPVVVGNMISWPDDGWYQVQNAATYESLCEGESECEVPEGVYTVINHTTGTRYENLLVEGDPVVEPPADPLISAANALPLLQSIAAVINEKAVDDFLAVTAGEVSTELESAAMFPMPHPLEDFSQSSGPGEGVATDYVMLPPGVGQASRLFEYACTAGGDMNWYIGPDGFHDYVFENCVVGEATYQGTASRRMSTLRGDYPITYYQEYQRTDSDGQQAELSGQGQFQYFYPFSNLQPLDYETSWNNMEFSVSANGAQQLLVSDYDVTRQFEKIFDPAEGPYCNALQIDDATLNLMEYTARDQVSGQFEVSADWSDAQQLSVELDLTSLDSVRVDCDDSSNQFSSYDPYVLSDWSGQIQVKAADGSSMTVRPVSDSEAGTPAFVIELGNGEQLGPIDWSGEYAIDARPDRPTSQ